jgi:hypothetical protein
LTTFLQTHKPHVLVVTETKLIATDKIKFPNYTITRKDRGNARTRGGGVLIAVRKGIPYSTKNAPLTSVETAAIQIAGTGLTIVGAYNPPHNYFKISELEKIMGIATTTIVAGDLNAKHKEWNCATNETNGAVLKKFADTRGITINHPLEPTHIPYNGTSPTTIDIYLMKNITNYSRAKAINELNSDHLPVTIEVQHNSQEEPTRTFRSFENTDWKKFRQELNRKTKITSNIRTIEQLEAEVAEFTKILAETIKTHTKVIKITERDGIPDETKSLITDRNKIRKLYQRTGDGDCKKKLIQLNEKITRSLITQKNNAWKAKLRKANPQDNTLWKIAKTLKKNRTEIPPLLTENGSQAITEREKAEALVEYFQSVHLPKITNTPEQEQIDEEARTLLGKTLVQSKEYWEGMRTNPHEIFKTLKNLKKNKAPGEDDVRNIALRNLPKKSVVQLCYITNAIIKLNHYPKAFKEALVVPIPKPGKSKGKTASYRPISLLSATSKIVEKVLMRRLNRIAKQHGMEKTTQAGFRKNHNTTIQLVRVINDIISEFNKSKTTAMTLIDLEKAFDSMWINGLIKKMNDGGIDPNFTRLIHSYLSKRTIKVKVNNTISTPRTIDSGVPQGSVLGPILFNLYTHDIPDFQKTKTALYADDMATYAHSYYAQAALTQNQIHVRMLEKYYTRWKLKINESKTENIIFARKRTNIKLITKLKVGDHTIPPKDTVKYLGLQLDARLNLKRHIKTATTKGNAAIRILYPLLNRNSGMSQENKTLLYKQVIRPIITYGAPILSHISNYAMQPLEVLQNKCMRLATGAPRYTRITDLRERTGLPSIREHTTATAERFFRRNRNHPLIASTMQLSKQTHKLLHHDIDMTTDKPKHGHKRK